jgi:SAM-dependent methyltransferase
MTNGPTTAEWEAHFSASWLEHADRLEAQLAAVDPLLFAAAALTPGMSVLDVGCGRGATTAAAAAAVGPTGRAVGVDLAGPLIDAARKLHGDVGEWLHADAQTHHFQPEAFDVVMSRFGVMFFTDPIAAFTNLLRATRPAGRLAVVVWQPRDCSELHRRPLDVAITAGRELGYELPRGPSDGGPFAYGVESHAHAVLADAGWHQLQFTPHELPFFVGGPGTSPAQATALSMAAGTLKPLLLDAPTEVIAHVTDSVTADFETCHDGVDIRQRGAIAIVTATASAA